MPSPGNFLLAPFPHRGLDLGPTTSDGGDGGEGSNGGRGGGHDVGGRGSGGGGSVAGVRGRGQGRTLQSRKPRTGDVLSRSRPLRHPAVLASTDARKAAVEAARAAEREQSGDGNGGDDFVFGGADACSLMHPPMKFGARDPMLKCILAQYDAHPELECDRECLQTHVRTCIDGSSDANASVTSIDTDYGTPSRSEPFLSSLIHCTGCTGTMRNSSDNGSLNGLGDTPALWLGPAASSNEWATGGPVVEGLLRAWRSQLYHDHGHKVLSPEESSCSRFSPSPGAHEHARDVARAQASCSPSVFLPGVQKAATTFLFNVLAAHPQVLRPVSGPGYKESGAVSLMRARSPQYPPRVLILSRSLPAYSYSLS